MRKNKILAMILAAALLLSLAACGGNDSGGQKGRYVEESVNSELGSSAYSAAMRDGTLTWLGEQEDGGYARFTQGADDKTASAQPLTWLNDLFKDGGSVTSVSEAPDGTVYGAYVDKDGQPGLAKSTDGKTATVISMEGWTAMPGRVGGGGTTTGRFQVSGGSSSRPSGGPGSGPGGGPQTSVSVSGPGGATAAFDPMNSLMPQEIAALNDGFLVSYMMQGVFQYDANGKEVRKFAETAREMGMGGFRTGGLTVYENTLIWPDTQKREIQLFDLTEGKLKETAAYEDLDSAAYVGMDAEGLFAAGSTGISRRKDSQWKLEVDGGLTSLIMPNLTVQSVFSGGEGLWYAILGAAMGESAQLYRYRYDPDIPSQPNKTLNIFSLYDNSTARLAIGEFQRVNPDVRVVMEAGIETGSSNPGLISMGPGGMAQEQQTDNSATVDDVIRALNTQLLAGKGPDLIILDGLPLQSYIEKGVLKDISALAQRLTTEEGLIANLTNAYAFDGKTYGLPSRFSLPVMLGESTRLGTVNGLAGLVSAVKAYGNQEPALLKVPDSLWQESGLIMNYYDASVAAFTNGNGSLDEAALAQYLTDALALNDAMREVYPEANQERRGQIAMVAAVGGGGARRIDSGAINIANGEALIHLQSLDNAMGYMMIANQLGALDGMKIESMFKRGYFTPVNGIGIVNAGKQHGLAEAFIQTLVGSAVQDNFMSDAFPVNRASWAAMKEQLEERFNMTGGGEFNDMNFLQLCESLDTPLFTDQYVKNAVSAQAKNVVNGTMTPEDAAAKIVADTRLYLAE